MAHTRVNKKGLTFYRAVKWKCSSGTEWPIYPHIFEESIRRGTVSYVETNCPHMIVVFILKGELLYRCGENTRMRVTAGSSLIIPINSDYAFTTTESKFYHKLVFEIRGNLLSSICNDLQLDRPLLLSPSTIPEMESEIRWFGKIFSDVSNIGIDVVFARLYGFLIKLSTHSGLELEDKYKLLSKAKFKLENEISKPLNMTAVAAELGICKALLNQIFRNELKISPMQYHINIKMREAKRLLSNTTLPIKEIALRTGYANQLYFSTAFKKKCAVSPLQFRRKNQSPHLCGKDIGLD